MANNNIMDIIMKLISMIIFDIKYKSSKSIISRNIYLIIIFDM